MSRQRHVVEGEWSGYRSSQQRVVHRHVTTEPERYSKLRTIQFTDNTTLRVSVRPCKPRESVAEVQSYCRLIEDAARLGKAFVTVRETEQANVD